MANSAAKSRAAAKKSPIVEVAAEDGNHVEPPPPEAVEPDPEMSPEEAGAKLVSDINLIPRKGKRRLLGRFLRHRKPASNKAA
jgi:hypothetical protein